MLLSLDTCSACSVFPRCPLADSLSSFHSSLKHHFLTRILQPFKFKSHWTLPSEPPNSLIFSLCFPFCFFSNILYDFLIMFNAYCISVMSGKNLYLVHGHVLTVQKKYWAQVKCPHDEWFIWQESMVLPLYEWHLNNWVSVPRCPLLRDSLCEWWWFSPFCFHFHNWSFPFRHILSL